MANPTSEMSPVAAHQLLMKFGARRGEPSLRLAMHAALPQQFRADLLHLIRLNFLADSDLSAESDVLLAEFCRDVGNGYYSFDAEVQSQLLDGLITEYAEEAEREPRTLRVARFLAAYVHDRERNPDHNADPLSREYLRILGWVALAYLKPEMAAEQLALELDGAIADKVGVTSLHITSLIASMAQPLVSHPRLLSYAAGLHALEEGRPSDAEQLLGPLEGLPLPGEVKARPVRELIAQWRERRGGNASETAQTQTGVAAILRPFFSNVPISGTQLTGRDRELAFLEEEWVRGTRAVEVIGPPLSGKWPLVTHWLHRHLSDTSVFVWDFTFVRDLNEFLKALLGWLGEDFSTDFFSGDAPESLIRKLRQERVLLVLREPVRSASETASLFFAYPLLRRLGLESAGMAVMTAGSSIGTGGAVLQLEDIPTNESETQDVWGSLRSLLEHYRGAHRESPLSLAMLGVTNPGSDPSSRVRRIISEVFGADAPLLRYSLTSFETFQRLSAALAEVSLAGPYSIVLWEDFDTNQFSWIPQFLRPMDDGRFEGSGSTSRTGKCIFIFTGKTTAADLYRRHDLSPEESAVREKFRVAEFADRLSWVMDGSETAPKGTVLWLGSALTLRGDWERVCIRAGYGFAALHPASSGFTSFDAFRRYADARNCPLIVCAEPLSLREAAIFLGDYQRLVILPQYDIPDEAMLFLASCDWMRRLRNLDTGERIALGQRWADENRAPETQVRLAKQQVALFVQAFGPDSPDTQAAQRSLAELERQTGNDTEPAGDQLRAAKHEEHLAGVPNRIFSYRLRKVPAKEICLVSGDIRNVTGIDVWVNSENTNMEMDRFFGRSISAAIRYSGARKDDAGNVVDDVIAKELRIAVGSASSVVAGTIVITGSGELAQTNNVKRIFHAAAVIGQPGRGYYPVADVSACVRNALTKACEKQFDALNIQSILFPLMGTGTMGGDVRPRAEELITAAISWMASHPASRVNRVCFLAFTDAELEACRQVLRNADVVAAESQTGTDTEPEKARVEKTVFLAYRRVDVSWALAIYQDLAHNGFDVFFDYTGIASGDFENVILENIKARAHFLVLLTPGALERTAEPGDWLRREIETAMDSKRNVVPLMLEGFDFATPKIAGRLTGKLAPLVRYNALAVPADFFLEAMIRLRERHLNVPLDAVSYPASGDARRAAAVTDPPPSAFHNRAMARVAKGDGIGAVEDFNEAIQLKPDFAEALSNRGTVRGGEGDIYGAGADITEVTRPSAQETVSPATEESPGAKDFVFISFDREDREQALVVARAFREAGVDVRMDQMMLPVVEEFLRQIETTIETCSFFVPLISRNSAAPGERFSRREWNSAIQVAEKFPPEYRFILPLRLDDTPLRSPGVPREFSDRQPARIEDLPHFVEETKRLIRERRSQRNVT